MGSRYESLEVSFRSQDEFEHEYQANIANGGIFVATDAPLAVRDKVEVRIKLHFVGKGIQLRGEVVHVVDAGLATAGATAGAAVQFEAPASELRSVFEPVLAAIAESRGHDGAGAGSGTGPGAGESEADDRRAAPRSRARVRARVHCPGCEIVEGRTRNLSITGVLVSIGSAPPIGVGEPVKVWVTNPETGVEREILGKVARHVTGEGGVVRAIGVQFWVRDSERKAVEQFLRDLRATEHSRHLGGIQGEISELGLANLVQTFGQAAREGTLDVMRGAEEGFVAFENGCMRAASLGGTTGVKALARMLSWTDGHFEFHARIDPELPPGEAVPMEGALLEAMRLIDESAGVDRRDFPPGALLGVDAEARCLASDLSKLDDAVLDLASAGMNLQRILDVIPETDDEIYMSLAKLVDLGIVAIRDA